MKPTTRKSNKLFYKTYLYKVSFKLLMSNSFRSHYQRTDSLDYTLSMINNLRSQLIDNPKKKYVEVGHYKKTQYTKDDIDDAEAVRDTLNSINDYRLRQEYQSQLFVYLNEPDILLSVLTKLKTVDAATIWKPDPAILNNTAPDVLVSTKAKDYAYKVTVNMYDLRKRNPSAENWIKNNRDKLEISDYSLEHGDSNSALYVRDEKILMLLQMTGSNFIKRTERLVLPG
jgi:hypothetical protein